MPSLRRHLFELGEPNRHRDIPFLADAVFVHIEGVMVKLLPRTFGELFPIADLVFTGRSQIHVYLSNLHFLTIYGRLFHQRIRRGQTMEDWIDSIHQLTEWFLRTA